MAGAVHIPWYATGFRGDDLQEEVERIARISTRYGASAFSVYRSREDRYKFLQIAQFESKADWSRYWEGPELIDFRTLTSGWWQTPIIYTWHDLVIEGSAVTASA